MAKRKEHYLLHLSDLHMESIQPELRDSIVEGKKEHKLATKIVTDIKSNFSQDPPLAVIISGDLTLEAKHGEFDNAKSFLISLSRMFDQPKLTDFLFLVPGNHDISWGEQYNEYSKENFNTFYKSLYDNGSNVDVTYHDGVFKKILIDHGIVFYGLNSACQESWNHPGVGYIDDFQTSFLEKDIQENRDEYSGLLKIAVLHHHLLPVCNYEFNDKPKETYSILTNADAVLQKLAHLNFSLVLHGHRHHYNHAIVKKYSKSPTETNQIRSNPIAVIGGGSLRRESERANTMYNIISILDKKPPSYYFSMQTRISNYAKGPYYPTIEIPITITQFPDIVDSNAIMNLALEADINITDVSEVFQTILSKCLRAANIEYGFLGIYDKTIQRIRVVAMSEKSPDKMKNIIIGDLYKIGQGITGHAFESRKIYATDDVLSDKYFSHKHKDIYSENIRSEKVSCLAAPIFNVDNSVCAIINVIKPRREVGHNNIFNANDKLLWSYLCNQIGPAINILVQKEQEKNNEKDLELIIQIQNELDLPGTFKAKLLNILNLIKKFYKLDPKDGEAIGFILKAGENYYYSYAETGFARKLEYQKGKGLTGGLIEAEKPDFALEHLKSGTISDLGFKTTSQCHANQPKKEELCLSYFGYPIFGEKECVGALVLNVVTPRGGTKDSLAELIKRYIRMLNIVSRLVSNKFKDKLIVTREDV
jgi:3',5'-cyclic AMP phosphodiesterase CpdA